MVEHVTDEDLELLDDLGVDTAPAATGSRTAREQRIIAGFEEIERFVEEHGRTPQHGEDRDIFERLYAVRLDRIRKSAECREALQGLDPRGLLDGGVGPIEESEEDTTDDADLLASLGVEVSSESDIAKLVHVRPRDEIKAAEEIAQRNPCVDFEQFRPLFEQVQRELAAGERQTKAYKEYAGIKSGNLFILDGQKALVASMGVEFVSDYGRTDRRLRVVYDNGTESDLLMRSLQRALYKDPASRRITEPGFGPLFADTDDKPTSGGLFSAEVEEGDLETGCIYVLRSKSDHPFIAEHRDSIHKIGVTSGKAKQRVVNSKKDPTYLLADVELVAEYKLANINSKSLEALLHKFFASARLDLGLKDRFGSQVVPKEWFLVPLAAIDESIERIRDGTIGSFMYEAHEARLLPK